VWDAADLTTVQKGEKISVPSEGGREVGREGGRTGRKKSGAGTKEEWKERFGSAEIRKSESLRFDSDPIHARRKKTGHTGHGGQGKTGTE
jgi:hypothetical protein